MIPSRVLCTLLLVAAARSIAVSGQRQNDDTTGARSMFYNPWTGTVGNPKNQSDIELPPGPRAKPAPRFVGVHYWLYLEGVGAVTESREFRTGERIRLHVRSNVDGYLAVWTAASDGRPRLLLPSDGDISGTRVKARDDYESPPIRFQPPAGNEHLYLAFAHLKDRLPSFSVVTQDLAASLDQSGGRDLVVEINERTAGEVGTYVVNSRGGPVARHIQIRHISP